MVLQADHVQAREAFREISTEPGLTGRFVSRVTDAAGTMRWVEATRTNRFDNPDVAGLIVTLRETTDRKRAELELGHRARHDELTGLPNRVLFTERLTSALSDQDAVGEHGVLFCDLDGGVRMDGQVTDAEGLLRRADAAMCAVKRGRRADPALAAS